MQVDHRIDDLDVRMEMPLPRERVRNQATGLGLVQSALGHLEIATGWYLQPCGDGKVGELGDGLFPVVAGIRRSFGRGFSDVDPNHSHRRHAHSALP